MSEITAGIYNFDDVMLLIQWRLLGNVFMSVSHSACVSNRHGSVRQQKLLLFAGDRPCVTVEWNSNDFSEILIDLRLGLIKTATLLLSLLTHFCVVPSTFANVQQSGKPVSLEQTAQAAATAASRHVILQ